MRMADLIRDKLETAFTPAQLSVEDESARHAGHAGARPGGETHFRVRIVSSAFKGVGHIARQRMIYAQLKTEMEEQIHALALDVRAPGEG